MGAKQAALNHGKANTDMHKGKGSCGCGKKKAKGKGGKKKGGKKGY